MNEQTHLKIVIAGLITAAAINNGYNDETATNLAIKQTKKIADYFRQQEKSK